MHKIIIASMIILVLNSNVYAYPMHSQEFRDSGNGQNSEVNITRDEEVDETGSAEYPSGLVEEIKSRILKSLQKTEAPKDHVPLPVLQRLEFRNVSEENRSVNETNLRINEKTNTDFLSSYVENTCIDDNGFPCAKFHFNIPPQDNFRSAELWLFKKEKVTEFSVEFTLKCNEKEDKSTTYVFNQTFSKSWVRFDVSHLISAENITNLQFIVAADNSEVPFETEAEKKPFLLIHTVSNLRSISKRSSSYCSNDSSACCREKYFIKFRDIKWDTWIIEPEGYEANYCKGTCTVNLSNSHHARVFMALCENNPRKFKQTGKSECLTCVATAYRPISVIYLDEHDIQVVNHLPGMSVTDCGCV